MGVKRVQPGELGVELSRIIAEYTEDVAIAIDAEVDKVAKAVKDDVVANSPKKTGKYAKGWAVKKDDTKGTTNRIVYNKTKPGLAHLLEFGHLKRGRKGRVAGRPHLAPAYDRHAPLLERAIENIIRNGGK